MDGIDAYYEYFNSRPHGGRLFSPFGFSNGTNISTHALTEGDGETIEKKYVFYISTHALTEGDRLSASFVNCTMYFNSRPHGGRPVPFSRCRRPSHFNSRPHGGRLIAYFCLKTFIRFQLTPSRRATKFVCASIFLLHISTHALTEGDA